MFPIRFLQAVGTLFDFIEEHDALCREMTILRRVNRISNKLIPYSIPFIFNRMGFDNGLMKVTILFSRYADKKYYGPSTRRSRRGQSSKSSRARARYNCLKRSASGLRSCPISLSFTNGTDRTRLRVASPQEAARFRVRVLHAFLLCA